MCLSIQTFKKQSFILFLTLSNLELVSEFFFLIMHECAIDKITGEAGGDRGMWC